MLWYRQGLPWGTWCQFFSTLQQQQTGTWSNFNIAHGAKPASAFLFPLCESLVVPVAQSDFWTQWQHTLLVDVGGVQLSQAGLAWEMSVPPTAWPFSQVLLIQELELEKEDGLQGMAKLPCQ